MGTTSKPVVVPGGARTSKLYTAPRTPWGDPGLQGNRANVYENGAPLERPEQFAGRKLEEIERFQTGFDAPDHRWQDAL